MFISRISKNKIADLTDFRKSKEFIAYVKKSVNTEFEILKREMISSFDQHPVTKEIEAGPNATNTSNTLGGVGNLFSYIGFEQGDKPTEVIRKTFEIETFISSFVFSKNGTFRILVNNPSPSDIFELTPLPWATGRSWVEGIEKGLSGFGFYLNKETDRSRSGSGIQSDYRVRSGKFKNTSYISKIIKDFERKIIRLNRQSF